MLTLNFLQKFKKAEDDSKATNKDLTPAPAPPHIQVVSPVVISPQIHPPEPKTEAKASESEANSQEDLPWVEWKEFKDTVIASLAACEKKQITSTLKSHMGFSSLENDYRLWITLEDNKRDVFVVMKPPTESMHATILIYSDDTLEDCLHSFFYREGQMYAPQYVPNEIYLQADLKKLNKAFAEGLHRSIDLPSDAVVKKQKPQKKTEARPKVKIPSMELENFSQLMQALQQEQDFDSRLNTLKQKMVLDTKDNRSKIWIKTDKGSNKKLMIVTEKTDFFESNTFHPTAKIPERPENDDKFDIFGIYETPRIFKKNILLLLRVSKGGKFTELVMIKKGKKHNGNELIRMLDTLCEGLGIRYNILQDDSKIAPVNPENYYRLRMVRPLIHEQGNTWYQSHNYSLYPCQDIPDEHFKSKDHKNPDYRFTYTQDPETYKRSWDLIKATKVKELIDAKEHEKSGKKALGKLLSKYGPKKEAKRNLITLPDLVKRIFKKMRSKKKSTRERADKRFQKFYENCLEWKELKEDAPDNLNTHFQKAVNVVQLYRLFIKRHEPKALEEQSTAPKIKVENFGKH